MQKLIKRTAQAQKQAARRAMDDMKRQRKADLDYSRRAVVDSFRKIKQNRKDARLAQKEDWELGPLAPRRDLAFNNFGAVVEGARTDYNVQGRRIMKPELLEKRCAWAGGVGKLCLDVGDRVVIMDGPDKGKIDRIQDIQMETATVKLETHNKNIKEGQLGQPDQEGPLPIPIDAIRLVYPLRNQETGLSRDVIIRHLKPVRANMKSPNMYFERWEYGKKHDRLVPGINTIIPWPEVKAPEFKAEVADTVREQVDERTFYYNLLSTPMPPAVLDELRYKFSKFRTRHEPWYIAKKEAEEAARKGRSEMLKGIHTPLEDLHDMEKEIKSLEGEPELSEDMLEKLGELIAKNKTAMLNKGGVSEVSSATSTSAEKTSPPPQ